MKRSFTLQSIIGICMLSLVISCHKKGDIEVPCRLLKIAHFDQTGSDAVGSYAGFLEYTSWGDPAKITWDDPSTGRPNYIFTYNNKRRLIRFEGLHSGTVFEFVSFYIYEGDKIVGDSSWYLGSDVNNYRQTAYISNVDKYTYDTKGRIIRIDGKSSFGNVYSTTYAYDAAGNRVRDGATYDNKKSYLRTNSWLMFVNRDFSMNNYRVADEYNKKGLPLIYQNTNLTFMNSLVNEFDYNCDHKNH